MTTYETRACTTCGKGWPAVASADCPFCNPVKQTTPREAAMNVMTMREKMARAMCEKARNQGSRGEKWDDISEGHRREWLGIAAAALDVLVEPTTEMLDAGVEAKHALYDRMEKAGKNTSVMVVAKHPAGTIYVAMIVAAKDGK